MTSQFSEMLSEIHDAMRHGQDSLFLRRVGRLAAQTKRAEVRELTALIGQIAPMLRGIGGTYSKLAVLAGALVERGASPMALVEVLPNGAADTMASYRALQLCWPHASGGQPFPVFVPPLVEAQLNEVEDALTSWGNRTGRPEELMLKIAYSWFSVNDWINPLISAMAHSRDFRAAMGSRAEVLAGATALAGDLKRAHWLRGLCLVCDEEPLLVLDPSSGRGYRMTMSGVGDNYQLHTLLADRLMGRGLGGLLDAQPPEASWVRAATTGSTGPFGPSMPIMRRLRLFDGRGTYIAPEGWPADIEPLDGMRVLVLHPPLESYGWQNGRSYVSLLPALQLEREIEPSEAAQWFSRIEPAREPQR